MTIVFDLKIDYKLYLNYIKREINLYPHLFFINIKNKKYIRSDHIFNFSYIMTYESFYSYYNIEQNTLSYQSYLSELHNNKNIKNKFRSFRNKYQKYITYKELENKPVSFCNNKFYRL